MSRTLLVAATAAVASLLLPDRACAEPTQTDPGRIVAVTVFQGQALVTREITLPGDEGLVEAIVTGLPERLIPGSLYAEPGSGVEVRSVRTRVRPIEATSREEVRELDEQIKQLSREIGEERQQGQLLNQQAEYLKQLESFAAGNAKVDLAKGVLDAEALTKITALVFREQERLAEQQVEHTYRLKELTDEVKLLNRKRQTLTAADDRSSREAVVFVSKQAGETPLRLMYLVSGATWSPSYNLRADEARTRVTVEYNAQVTQMSGEDWSDVDMILSTATPSLVATPPRLEPLDIRLIAQPTRGVQSNSRADLSRQQKAIALGRGGAFFESAAAPVPPASVADRVLEADKPNRNVAGFAAGGFGAVYSDNNASLDDVDLSLNRLACEVQVLDLSGKSAARAAIAPPEETEGISVVYRLPNRTSLPSRSDKQLIQIASLPVEAEFYHVATPVLTSYVYEEAKLVNNTKSVLLAGPAATFLGDRFVGRGQVPSIAIGESFTVGLGINESLRASRELIDQTDKVQGGNRVATFDYQLTIENFGDTDATVRLMDRLPKSDGKAIKVTLVESDPEPDEDFGPSKEGFVRWTLDASDDEVSVNYTLQIEHDKNLSLVGGVR